MKKLNLLFITKDFSNHIERNTYYLGKELEKIVHLKIWYDDGNIKSILKNIDFVPDFILLNDFKKTRCPNITGLSNLRIPFGVIAHDLHYKPEERKDFFKDNNVQHIFSNYRDAFYENFPKYADRLHWFPHFVNTNVFKDYKLPKEIDWLMMGMLSIAYPLREEIYETMKDKPGFVYHGHPGYDKLEEDEYKLFYVGKRYAEEINRAKIFLTDNSIFEYPLIKYFEVLACNTLLLAPSSQELNDLGFIPDVNFISINSKNFLDKAEYYLNNEEKRLKIAKAGYKMVRENHSVTVRAGQLVEIINNIIKK